MTIYVGIDPGASGGIAAIYGSHTAAHSFRNVSPYWLSGYIEEIGDTLDCFGLIEKVHAMPGQGVVSTFNFGVSFGMLEGFLIAAGVPYDRVTPQAWQKGYGLFKQPGESHTDKKNRHKKLAQSMFPGLSVTHATADALLIAEFCRRKYEVNG